MSRLEWDKVGEHYYETGVDHAVFYAMNSTGGYTTGEAWNGITGVTESPSGAESNPQYGDNIKYLDLISAEEYGLTIEAFGYPDGFAACNGEKSLAEGVTAGQQTRSKFGFSYRSKIGNDTLNDSYGYKLHLVYNCQAAPSEVSRTTVSDSPEPITLSWEITTTPVEIGTGFRPTACITIDSTTADATKLAALEAKLYGTEEAEPTLPTPAEVMAMFTAA